MDNFSLTSAVSVVPAPVTLAIFGLGLVGLGCSRRKKA
ncbi:PEP-CTERM sorting domain-containing protein [Paraglaciecola sp. MB-3u-78]